MKFSLTVCQPEQQLTDCLMVGVYHDHELAPSTLALDKSSQKAISTIIKQGDLPNKPGSILLLQAISPIKSKRILLIQLGKKEQLTDTQFIKICKSAFNALNKNSVKIAHFTLCEIPVGDKDLAWKISQAILLCNESLYQFNVLKSIASPSKIKFEHLYITVANATELALYKITVKQARAISEGVYLTKSLGNLPGNICTPSYLAAQAKKLATKDKTLTVKVLDKKAIQKLGMNAFLAVSQGSSEPPQLILLDYKGGASQQKPIILVGKGITFDSGGISLKPAAGMSDMKFDMLGAASVLGTLQACQLLKLPLNVMGIIPTAENMPGNKAVKPGDIVTGMSGQTIEINNTDAEGRLILSDALTYAAQFNPELVIDIATLTGAIVIALGTTYSAVFSKEEQLRNEIIAAGNTINDLVWPMPLHENYDDELKSDCADMSNIGGRNAGACIGAQFLGRFTSKFKWAHLDIAGSAFPCGQPKFASGRPVPLLVQFLLNYSEKKRSKR